jgi:ABC-type polysaccharide/polyol phosphate transport system ATPase subunit
MELVDSDIIVLKGISKIYKLYNTPFDRLKESISLSDKKYHTDFYALSNISFNISKGETVGIIGKNGSGKSTLLKIITGVLTPTHGQAKAQGKISSILELGAGFNLEYTGIENIFLNGTILGFSESQIESKLESILSFADIGDFVYQPVKLYSSGMFARLAFALAINVEPEILIVDEALAVGDIKFQTKCYNKFNELKKEGVTILFVSHDINLIRQFCTRALWIDSGKLRDIGDTVEVTAKYIEYMNSEQNEAGKDEVAIGLPEKASKIKRSEFNPINRWGKEKELIQFVEIYNKEDKQTGVFEIGEIMKLKVISYIPGGLDLTSLSIAFSIKNISGIDLMVSTTFEKSISIISCDCYVEVIFDFLNYLNPGDYVINVAIEDRSNTIPEYYDYIEGAKYFKSSSSKQTFGMFSIPVSQQINYFKE